jgi:3-hydroxybutyryl-CoA dehydrogenase
MTAVCELPAVVAVIGGGRMGAGIAREFAVAGADVMIVEADETAAQAATKRVLQGLRRADEKGQLKHPQSDIIGRIHTITAPQQIPSETELVVEAVPDAISAKLAVLTAAEAAVSCSAVLASNTSSLPITYLGAALNRPQSFIGMHFFNPVPASALVEIVRTSTTSTTTIAKAQTWVRSLDKSAVLINDSPGFATSRLGVLLGLEAIRMLEEGVADAESIDRAMELGYRHPMGPLRSTDLVGLDVRLAIAEHLTSTLGDRFTPPQLMRDKVCRGELGRKTGKGFYHWPDARADQHTMHKDI